MQWSNRKEIFPNQAADDLLLCYHHPRAAQPQLSVAAGPGTGFIFTKKTVFADVLFPEAQSKVQNDVGLKNSSSCKQEMF